MVMPKEIEETPLNQEYYLIQKNIGSNWTDRGRYDSESEAKEVLDKQVDDDMNSNSKFIYRLIKIKEIILIKSKEKNPDDMLDYF